MDDLYDYDESMESLGFQDLNHKPRITENIGGVLLATSAQGFNPNLFKPENINPSNYFKTMAKNKMPIIQEHQREYLTKYFAWALTQDIDKYESKIVDSINKLRKTLRTFVFSTSEVNLSAGRIHHIFNYGGTQYVRENTPVIIAIPVVPNGVKAKTSPIYPKWAVDATKLCESVTFPTTNKKFGDWLKTQCRFNESNQNIEVFITLAHDKKAKKSKAVEYAEMSDIYDDVVQEALGYPDANWKPSRHGLVQKEVGFLAASIASPTLAPIMMASDVGTQMHHRHEYVKWAVNAGLAKREDEIIRVIDNTRTKLGLPAFSTNEVRCNEVTVNDVTRGPNYMAFDHVTLVEIPVIPQNKKVKIPSDCTSKINNVCKSVKFNELNNHKDYQWCTIKCYYNAKSSCIEVNAYKKKNYDPKKPKKYTYK